MKALGLVETKGLLAAIEASDVMLKTAEVTLTQKELVGGGLVTVMVTGDVGAVKTAVDAAASAVSKLGAALLETTHVIPRPDESLALFERTVERQENSEKSIQSVAEASREAEIADAEEGRNFEEKEDQEEFLIETSQESEALTGQPISGATFLEWGKAGKIAELEAALAELKVIDLRKLAKKQTNFAINKKDVHKANKEQLVSALSLHFQKG